ncbi:hypothetical protein RSAG8_11799, partial [Rhizoctonia solani AG-8 WAC10335]
MSSAEWLNKWALSVFTS